MVSETMPVPIAAIAVSITGASTEPHALRRRSSIPARNDAGRNRLRSSTCTGLVGSPETSSASGVVPARTAGRSSASQSSANIAGTASSRTSAPRARRRPSRSWTEARSTVESEPTSAHTESPKTATSSRNSGPKWTSKT